MRTPTPPDYKRDDKQPVQERRTINAGQISDLSVFGCAPSEGLSTRLFLNTQQGRIKGDLHMPHARYMVQFPATSSMRRAVFSPTVFDFPRLFRRHEQSIQKLPGYRPLGLNTSL